MCTSLAHGSSATCREKCALTARLLRQCLSECVYGDCNYHNRIAPLISGASNSFARTVIDVCFVLTKSECASWTAQVDCCCICTTNPRRPYSMTHHESECACVCNDPEEHPMCGLSSDQPLAQSMNTLNWVLCSALVVHTCLSKHSHHYANID